MPAFASAQKPFNFNDGNNHSDDADALASQAARCRRLAAAIGDRETSDMLNRMAEGYERNAAALRR